MPINVVCRLGLNALVVLTASELFHTRAFASETGPLSTIASPWSETNFENHECALGEPSREPPAWTSERIVVDSLRTNSIGLFDELVVFAGLDGSKQPQDFGVNAHLGGQASVNWGIPLIPAWGLGLQAGTGITSTANAVRVFDLLGETTGRTQSYTTLGVFQRTQSGFAWGFAHDFLNQNYFDDFRLSQWRIRSSYQLNAANEIGISVALRSRSDNGLFGGATPVTLRSIDQGHVYWRHFWPTAAQTSFWMGLADGHGENNAVTGPSPAKDEQFLFGADLLVPLTASLALYGEANMIMPSDTGTVDAFLGIQWYPSKRAFRARRGSFSPLIPLAAPTSFAVDLRQ